MVEKLPKALVQNAEVECIKLVVKIILVVVVSFMVFFSGCEYDQSSTMSDSYTQNQVLEELQ
jgi:hypothetical protein